MELMLVPKAAKSYLLKNNDSLIDGVVFWLRQPRNIATSGELKSYAVIKNIGGHSLFSAA